MKINIAVLLLVVMLMMTVTACKKADVETSTVETIGETTVETTEAYAPGVGPNIFEDVVSTESKSELPTENVEMTEIPTETTVAELKTTEPKPTEPKPTEPKPTESKPTEPKPTESKPTEPKPTEPKPTEPKPTEPKPTESEPTEPKADSVQTEYEKYMAMSGAEQKAYMESFGSVEAFFNWLTSAKAEHEALKPDIPIEDGKIDLG